VINALTGGPQVNVTVSGLVAGELFEGHDVVTRVVSIGAGPGGHRTASTAPRASVSDCVPNPFNPVTTIQYHVAGTGWVSLVVYDVSGRRVRGLVSEVQGPRPEGYSVQWDGRNDAGAGVASGLYFYRMVSLGFSETKKMLLLK